MKIKTSELTGPALDWAVAKASERLGAWRRDESRPGGSILDIDFDEYGELCEYVPGGRRDPYKPWRPSTDWSQSGPLLKPNRISIMQKHDGWWRACIFDLNDDLFCLQWADDPLIAAMCCFVASKLGDEVDVPEELL